MTQISFFPQGISIHGFNINRFCSGGEEQEKSLEEALTKLSEWCRDGKIRPHEHVLEGFENMPKAFIEQLEGVSQGKVIVRV